MSGAGRVEQGLSQAAFEAERRQIALRLLEKTDEFLAWDLEFNKKITTLMDLMLERVREKPSILDSAVGIRDFTVAGSGSAAGLSGGDVMGGNAWDDIFGVIKELLVGEKEFIEGLITKIFGL